VQPGTSPVGPRGVSKRLTLARALAAVLVADVRHHSEELGASGRGRIRETPERGRSPASAPPFR
jgi:hypothetical protein